MNNFTTFEIVLYCAELLLLIYGSVSDVKHRRIPLWTGIASVVLGLVSLLYGRHYWMAIFFAAGVFAPSYPLLQVLMLVLVFPIYSVEGAACLPFVLGLLLILYFFKMKMIGGGDTQMLFGMYGIAYRGWTLSLLIAAITILTGVFTSIKVFGFKKAMSRLPIIAKSMFRKNEIEHDTEKIKTPFLLVLAEAWAILGIIKLFVH